MQHTDKAIAEFEAWWIRQPHREQFEAFSLDDALAQAVRLAAGCSE